MDEILLDGGVDDADASNSHAEYVKDGRNILIENADGLWFTIRYYPTYGWIYGSETQTYYKMTSSMIEWFNENMTN